MVKSMAVILFRDSEGDALVTLWDAVKDVARLVGLFGLYWLLLTVLC